MNKYYSDDFGISFTDFSINVIDRYDELAEHFIKMNESALQKCSHNIQGENYSLLQMIEIAKKTSAQSNGVEGNMLNLGMGVAFANNIAPQMVAAMSVGNNVKGASASDDRKLRKEKLLELKELLDEGFITQEEYNEKRILIIKEL